MNEKRVETQNKIPIDKTILKLAIYQVVMMWGDPHYERFLRRTGRLDEDAEMFDWFAWFLGEWRVQRNIGKKHRLEVREYLEGWFRKRLKSASKPQAVDKAAQHIKQEKWTSKGSKNGNGPVSLVSKIGFFFEPKTLVPYDRFAREGLKHLRRMRGIKKSKKSTKRDEKEAYSRFFNDWTEEFEIYEKPISDGLKQTWVEKLAKRFGCPAAALQSPVSKRKVFDNYLMAIGRKSVTFKVKAQRHKDGQFSVPKKICDKLELKGGDKIALTIRSSAGIWRTVATLRSGREIYGTGMAKHVKAGEKIVVTARPSSTGSFAGE